MFRSTANILASLSKTARSSGHRISTTAEGLSKLQELDALAHEFEAWPWQEQRARSIRESMKYMPKDASQAEAAAEKPAESICKR